MLTDVESNIGAGPPPPPTLRAAIAHGRPRWRPQRQRYSGRQVPPVSDDRPTKVCPDCAESVLAAAQKCRFCGYRFDGRAPATASEGVLGLLRRAEPPQRTLPELLDGWGIRLHEDDGVTAFCHGSIDGQAGYIVIT